MIDTADDFVRRAQRHAWRRIGTKATDREKLLAIFGKGSEN